ncbi:protein BIG GRAIN 1-like [Phalaenopsis equestris]|uniref:protein BIG GRAIN 1-like n=1 Tax=Phalaenopsis equestris TaxID=78828 RepID=UPI0009E338D5|nr:protein BIG GRAIN 1-like [Phalaenopsis equestris]
MEKFAHSRRRNNPSFSSSLLDSIYRSIDQSDRLSPGFPLSSTSKTETTSIDKKWIPKPPPPTNHPRHFFTSSSSDCSSFGGFSSSDADFTAPPRLRPVPARCDRYCSDSPPERKRTGSIRSRICNLQTPASPGARLAAFLNSIFASGSGKPKKQKFAGGQEESARSYINRMLPSSRDGRQRSVRFSSASIAADGDSREKRHFGEVPMLVRDRQMVLEEFLRGFDMEEEEETDCDSVSSSELFELESLATMRQFTDELPVYGTTNFSANRAVAHGFMAQN